MTALLERTDAAGPQPVHVPPPSRAARWWAGWRVALRLARRDAWRGKGRSLLVVLLVALPVATATGVVVFGDAAQTAGSPRNLALRSLGPVADARIGLCKPGVTQALDLSESVGCDASAITPAQALAALPAGTRLVATGGAADVVLESGGWGVSDTVAISDVADPLNAASWRVDDGRLPRGPGEIALGAEDLRRLQSGLGSRVTVTTISGDRVETSLTVVGVVTPQAFSSFNLAGVVTPGVLPSGGQDVYLATTPRPLDWADVRRANAAGAVVVARGVLESPPPFCTFDGLCLDAGPDPGQLASADQQSETSAEEQARTAALVGVALVLVVLQVALLAGPAFAVQLRRRQRELGLLGASGGDAVMLRRTVLASGFVLGLAGGLLGLVLGWVSVGLLGGALPWAPLAQNDIPLGVPGLPWYCWGAAAVGLVSAMAAALVPAVIAGRGQVLDTLRGRRPLPPVKARTPLIGVGLGAAGIALMLYGRTMRPPDAVVLGCGLVLAELGLVLVMPWLVVQATRLGPFLPLTPRMALRDSGRHRLRTATAACAIAAAAAAAVATSTWQTSQTAQFSFSGQPYVVGSLVVQGGPDAGPTGVADARRVVDQVAAPSASVGLQNVVPRASTGAPAQAYDSLGRLTCVVPSGAEPPSTPDAAGELQVCGSAEIAFGTYSVQMIDDPDTLGALLGPLVPVDQAIAVLKAGGAVATVPGALDRKGRLWLRPEPVVTGTDGSQNQTFAAPVALPGAEASGGTVPAPVIVGPAALAPGGALASVARVDPSTFTVIATPTVVDRPDRPTVADQVSIGLAKARVNGNASVTGQADHGTDDGVAIVLAVAVAATLLMALLAGLMVTALALADGRSDLVTLTAVGAPPRTRRRIAAAQAGVVATLGCTTGAVSGLVVAYLLVGLFYASGGRAFEIRWWLVAAVVVGVPLVTAAAAWLTTRSRVTIPRRTDS